MIRKTLKLFGLGLLAWFVASSIVVAHQASEIVSKCKPGQHMERGVRHITFSRSKYPHIVAHIERSWDHGYPKILKVNREGARQRRDQLLNTAAGLRKWPRHHDEDRDEAPATALRSKVRADVEYVDDHENQSAGSHLRYEIKDMCDGQRVRYRFIALSSKTARGTA